MIERVGRKWLLYTRDGSRVLGKHDTEGEALAQERAIQARKHARAGGGAKACESGAKDAKGAKDGAGSRSADRSKLERVGDGVYEGDILGVPVRVVRGVVGVHPYYHTFSHQPEWKVKHRGQLLADGHGTMSGAVAAAERAILHRGLDQTEEAIARFAARRRADGGA